MCGIAGFLGIESPGSLEAMVNALRHRGPDSFGTWNNAALSVGLAHARLSIIDPSPLGQQPMLSRCGRYRIVFNGEIYNYRDLRRELEANGKTFLSQSDTEVLVEGFSLWETELFNKIRGMFAFAIWDEIEQKVILCRDRFGIKPLYYHKNAKRLLFASELSAFRAVGDFSERIRLNALKEYMIFGSILQPGTIWDSTHALMPGHYLEVSSNLRIQATEYHKLESIFESGIVDIEFGEAKERVRSALEEATRYHLTADVEVGAFLSGGVDSTAVVALMQQQSSRPIKTFTIGFSPQQGAIDESKIAAETAKIIGTDHHPIHIDYSDFSALFGGFIRALDQPSADGLNTYIVSQAASREVKVCLSGIGGDEIFGGYTYYKDAIFQQRDSSFLTPIAKALHACRPNRFTMRHISSTLSPSECVFFQRSGGRVLDSLFEEQCRNLSGLQSVSYTDLRLYLLNTLLRDSDVMSMAHSLELRPVLLDHPLVELALRLPDSYKILNHQLKRVFIESMCNRIPESVRNQKKNGFTLPYLLWFSKLGKSNISDMIDTGGAKFLIDAGLISKNYYRSMSQRIKNNNSHFNDYRLYILIYWLSVCGNSY
jgi:asparagine synthase (glutamine-hydrolysing)